MGKGVIIAIGVIVLAVALAIVVPCAMFYSTKTVRVVTVKEKWIKASGSDRQRYLFSDTRGNVYQIKDSWMLLRFDASDRWARLDVGETYRITFYGWRIRFWSMYRNAVEIEEVP